MAEKKSLIVKNSVKEATELSVSEEFLNELDKMVLENIQKAESRAKANSRRTLYARDL